MTRALLKRLARGAITALVLTETSAHAEDLSFGRALKLAKQRAPEMRAARARLAGAEAGVGLARAGYYPTLTATGAVGEDASGDTRPTGVPAKPFFNIVQYTTSASATGTLRWNLYDFGKTGNSVAAAEASRDAAESSTGNDEASLVNRVAAAYLDVVYAMKTRDIQAGIADDREKSFIVVKALVKQGISPAVEELRSRSRIESARRDFEAADANMHQARVTLLALLGMDPKSEPKFSQPKLPKTRLDVEAAAKEAEEKKPSVLASKANASASDASVDAARSRYLPTIGVSGDANYRYFKIDTLDSWLPSRGASGSLFLTVPIYDPTNGSRLDQAKANALSATATYDLARREARTAASRAIVGLQTSEKVLDHAHKAAEATGAVLAVIRARFQSGLTSMLDLIEAETSDAEARIAEVNAEKSVDLSILNVYDATGRFTRLYDVQ